MRGKQPVELCKMMLWLIVLMWLLVAVLMCTGCVHTRYVPVESIRADSIYLTALQSDSIIIRDSVIIRQTGDTVYIDKVRYQHRVKLVCDTVYQYRDREIQVPVPIERPLSWWDKLVQGVGGVCIPIALILLTIIAARVWLKWRGGQNGYLKRGRPDVG